MDIENTLSDKNAVLFDLFFTLVSPDIDDEEFPPTYEVLGIDKLSWRKQTFSSSNARFTGAEQDPYEIVRSMAHSVDAGISDTVIREATDQRIARFKRVLKNVPESTLTVLTELRRRGFKLGLISNADTIETQAWENSPLASLFDVKVFSWQVGAAKPEAKIYNHCLDLLSITASQGIFVGDGGSDELSGAKAVGLTPVFATGMIPELSKQEILDRESFADHKIEKLEELLSLLTR